MALVSIFTVVIATKSMGDDIFPSRSNFGRYSAMVENSPFAIATAVALPAAPADFAKDLYVANAAQTAEGDMVTIASLSDQNFKKYLTTTQSVDGYDIVSIEWSDRVGATKVTISKDGKSAILSFNQALLSQRASPNVPPPDVPLAPVQIPQSMPSMPPTTSVNPPLSAAETLQRKLKISTGGETAPPLNPRLQQEQQQEQARRKFQRAKQKARQ